MPDLSNERIFPAGVRLKAVFQPEVRWRLVEEFGSDCFETQSDGSLLFCREYSDDESLIDWMLTFRNQVEVLEPEEIRQKLLEIAKNVTEIYEEKSGKGRRQT